MRKGEKPYLFKEDYLRLGDYLYAWAHAFRVQLLQVDEVRFLGFDVSGLVREELGSLLDLGSQMTALLNHRFPQRLKEAGVKVSLAVDWFENQVVDKGWNRGFRSHMPEAETIGNLGYIQTAHYQCIAPSCFEQDMGLLPDRISVTGPGMVQQVKEFCQSLDVRPGPALRFSALFDPRKILPPKDDFPFWSPYPFSIAESVSMVHSLANIQEEMPEDVHFLLKPHPTIPKQDILDAWKGPLPPQITFVEGNIVELIDKSKLLVSRASSTCMESLARGTQVIVLGTDKGLTYDPLPKNVPKHLRQICYTEEELRQAVFSRRQNPMGFGEAKRISDEILKTYFRKPDRPTIREFLGLDP